MGTLKLPIVFGVGLLLLSCQSPKGDYVSDDAQIVEQSQINEKDKYLITNTSAGYFTVDKAWKKRTRGIYNYEEYKGEVLLVDGSGVGGYLLNDKKTKENPDLCLVSKYFNSGETKEEYATIPSLFYIEGTTSIFWYYEDKINEILIYSDKFKTKEGVCVGMRLDDLQKKLGPLTVYTGWLYEDENAILVKSNAYSMVRFVLNVYDCKRTFYDSEDASYMDLTMEHPTIADFKKQSKIQNIIISTEFIDPTSTYEYY